MKGWMVGVLVVVAFAGGLLLPRPSVLGGATDKDAEHPSKLVGTWVTGSPTDAGVGYGLLGEKKRPYSDRLDLFRDGEGMLSPLDENMSFGAEQLFWRASGKSLYFVRSFGVSFATEYEVSGDKRTLTLTNQRGVAIYKKQ